MRRASDSKMETTNKTDDSLFWESARATLSEEAFKVVLEALTR
jgi:hypothetical protein